MDHPRDECGVFGVYAPGEDVARLTYFGLYSLQHRGQESAGIATSNGANLTVYRDLGLVAQVFNEKILNGLEGHLGIGHVRYSTTGSSHRWENAQPAHVTRTNGGDIALGHNGNLVNTAELAADIEMDATTDSHVIAELLARQETDDLVEAFRAVQPQLKGAYSLVAMDEGRVYGIRDPHGVRPLAIGKLPSGGWVLASETCALDIVGADYLRDVEPGELVVLDETGLHSHRLAEPTPRLCVFEFVYLARPDSVLYGRSVYGVRRAMGKQLADEAPAEADLVIPVPDTAHAAAQGYADRSDLPYGEGLIKNRYVGRTFIQPSQSLRRQGVRLKLNPLVEVIEGKRLVVVDDSIVRGTTTREIVQMLRRAGAREIHMRISSPPIRWPCFYGIDTANRDELIASERTDAEIMEFIGADSLGYLSLDGMLVSTGIASEKFCHACFSGGYPIPIPAATALSKNVLE
ncbi:MAG TPA: amidophosphoribosyltransferase [Actinomycetota bacterium]|nr:amidophosphoribosyltransferase [Actinomycetota bacterium]